MDITLPKLSGVARLTNAKRGAIANVTITDPAYAGGLNFKFKVLRDTKDENKLWAKPVSEYWKDKAGVAHNFDAFHFDNDIVKEHFLKTAVETTAAELAKIKK